MMEPLNSSSTTRIRGSQNLNGSRAFKAHCPESCSRPVTFHSPYPRLGKRGTSIFVPKTVRIDPRKT